MEKKRFQRRLLSWWTCVENEFDSSKVVSCFFDKQENHGEKEHKATCSEPKAGRSKSPQQNKESEKLINNCLLIKDTLTKLSQFINASHKNGCSDPRCIYSKKDYRIDVVFVAKEAKTIPKKRQKRLEASHNSE